MIYKLVEGWSVLSKLLESLRYPKIRGNNLGFPIIRIIGLWVYKSIPLFVENTTYVFPEKT